MAYARSREGWLEAPREVKEALEDLPDQPPQGVLNLHNLPFQFKKINQ